MKTYALILAAGKSTRMNTSKSKMLQPMLDRGVIEYVVNNVKKSMINDIYVVVGHQKEQIMELLKDQVTFIEQVNQKGTADALLSAYEELKDKQGNLLVTCGDMPLIDENIIRRVIDEHINKKATATLLVSRVSNPKGLGRIVTKNGVFERIVEEREASIEEKKINIVNSGTYCFDIEVLFQFLRRLKKRSSGEFYLTDIFELMVNEGKVVNLIYEEDETCMYGINDFYELNRACNALKRKINTKHCLNGVNIQDLESTYIGKDVIISSGSTILPNTYLYGKTIIKEGAVIGPNTQINNSVIGKNSVVTNSVVDSCTIDENCLVGPFANLKNGSHLHDNVVIGDFVEVKKSEIGHNTKAKHHAYIGDAKIGRKVNIGCGVIFANYDGKKKHLTLVKDNVFIGSNVTLVAPLEINENSYIAAGSTITDNIPQNTLAIARQRQVNKLEYVWKMKDKNS